MSTKTWSMEDQINQIHETIKNLYPEAVSVNIFVNSQGIEVTPEFRTNVSGCSMQTITGKWVKKCD